MPILPVLATRQILLGHWTKRGHDHTRLCRRNRLLNFSLRKRNTMKQKNIWLATLVAIASIAGAQSNEGPTIFTGATTSPDAVVSINQTGDGNLINGTTKSGALVLTVDPSGAVGSVGPGAGVAGW